MLQSLFNKVAGLKTFNFNQKRGQHRCFPVNIAKFLREAFLADHLLCLLLAFAILTTIIMNTEVIMLKVFSYKKFEGQEHLQPNQKRDSGTGVFL